jgi:hypothetical protein
MQHDNCNSKLQIFWDEDGIYYNSKLLGWTKNTGKNTAVCVENGRMVFLGDKDLSFYNMD